jgi:NitT/TauT family transport system permease protein
MPGLVILAAWEIGARYLFDPQFIGQPSRIIESLVLHLQTGRMWHHVWITFGEIAIGYTIGLAVGGGIGYVLGLNRALAEIFEPYILAFNAIPKVAIAPLLILTFGIGMGSKVAIIVSLVFFLMFYNVYVGIRVIDIEFVYQARIMGATRWGEIRYVILPAIMPNVMVGLKTSSVYAVIGAVIGEFIAAHAGIGFFILDASGMFNVTDIWVGVAFLMLLLLAMTGLITLAERRLLRWMPRGSRR